MNTHVRDNLDHLATLHGCLLYKNGNQTITNNTATDVVFSNEHYDTDTLHSTAANQERITVAAGLSGHWLLFGQVTWDSGGTGWRAEEFHINGSRIHLSRQAPATSTPSDILAAVTRSLVAGDYATLRVTHTQGANLDILGAASGDLTQFGAVWLKF